jgi:pyruvate,water dikinase
VRAEGGGGADTRKRESQRERRSRKRLEEQYLASFSTPDQPRARELLELGRASYRLRDDDNIYLGRFESLAREAEQAAKERLRRRGPRSLADKKIDAKELVRALRDAGYRPSTEEATSPVGERDQEESQESDRPRSQDATLVESRQMRGQPASQGIATGRARVVSSPRDLFSLKKGEVLVCDSIDPSMTMVAPLAVAIVERRGGMLIHGAIIAREYGIPCVTGVPDAAVRIATGDRLTVDGYLGIVVKGGR